MSKIKCKYKFKNAEKFDGKTYCTCHNELCENISFCCDNNCQIYEDYKQLQTKEQECEKFKNRVDELKNVLAKVNKKINRIIEIDGYGFDEALTEEFESIKNLIRKAVFTTGENECQTKE